MGVSILLQLIAHSCFVSCLSINSTCHSRTSNISIELYGQLESGGYQGASSEPCSSVCFGFCERCCFQPETGVAILSEAAAFSDSITSSSLYTRWSEMESNSSGRIIEDLKARFGKALDRRRVVKDTGDQWYALGAMRPSSGESSSQ